MAHWIEKNWPWVLGGAAVAVGGAMLLSKNAAASTTVTTNTTTPAAVVPTTPTAPTPPPNWAGPAAPPVLVALQPNVPNGSVKAKMGAAVSISLPPSATWVSNNGTVMSGNAPIQWVYQGPGTVALVWTDATGAQQTTILTFLTG